MAHPSEEQLTEWMREALSGNDASYRVLLATLAPLLRRIAVRGLARYGIGAEEAEDVVQDTLLAVHLKRHTWRTDSPFMPWLQAVARNKLIDALRRRGRRVSVPIEDVEAVLEAPQPEAPGTQRDIARMLARLKEPHRSIVQGIMLDERPPRELAERFGMSEGAVRVALHRALKRLASLFNGDEP